MGMVSVGSFQCDVKKNPARHKVLQGFFYKLIQY